MSILKISMAGWLLAREEATREKIAAARRLGVPTVTGGSVFEIAVVQGQFPAYLDLCADLGVTRIECAQGFTDSPLDAGEVVRSAAAQGLDVQFELGKKHDGPFDERVLQFLVQQGRQWLDAGAVQLVVEARESAQGVELFDDQGDLAQNYADLLVERLGLTNLMFEAPTKPSQFALLKHFGRHVHLCNVRLEEVLRVEGYRRGLHSDSFGLWNLRPEPPGRQRMETFRSGKEPHE